MLNILVIEDEKKVARFIQRGLLAEGMNTEIAEDGDEGLRLALERNYDVITVDLMMPGIDGVSLIEKLQVKKQRPAVLVLSARDTLQDKLRGFAAGADDYLLKPFAFEELIARIRALARRTANTIESSSLLTYDGLEMDLLAKSVRREGKTIELTAKEYRLLEYFMRNPEVVISRTKIAEAVWSEQFDRDSNIVDVFIMYLRKKIDTGFSYQLLHTVRGMGYVLRKSEPPQVS
jgi:DNA-binding response OmpR family regulator